MERQARPGELERVLSEAGPGDEVVLLPGIHQGQRIRIPAVGRAGAALVIRGMPGAVLDGGRSPNPNDLADPDDQNRTRQPQQSDWCFFSLVDVEHVVFEGLEIRQCWPMAIYAQNCRFITLRRAHVTGGNFAFFANDETTKGEGSHHFLIEKCTWIQDDSADHKVWSTYDWRETHGNEGGGSTLRYFNGGFFGSGDIIGDVVIRHNAFSDAYNGVVFWASDELRKNVPEMQRRNQRIAVCDNTFTRIRDNPIEPEGHIRDFLIARNHFVDCHGWFSLDCVRGGYWYIYGNTGRFTSRQGGPRSNTGKVFKFADVPPYADEPVYVFHNSWRLRCPVIAGDEAAPHRTRNLWFFGNAIEFCRPGWDGPICGKVGFIEAFDWLHSAVSFDGDVSNHPDFPKLLREAGHEANGRAATGSIFVSAGTGDFSLAAGGAAIGAGRPFTLLRPGGQTIDLQLPDAGAIQNGVLLAIPELEK